MGSCLRHRTSVGDLPASTVSALQLILQTVYSAPTPPVLRGVPRWCDRFILYDIKVSFWGSGTLKIVIYVENYPQERSFRLADYHPHSGWEGVN